ncbi:MAG: hypothetical protein WC673_00760 [Candidatus Paceibacterota bacterium]|jgi:CheY-like chemotaxis protein
MKTFVIVEPNKEVCEFMVVILSRFLKDRAKVVDFLSFNEALEKLPSINEVAMVFVALDAPTERGAYVAGEFKKALLEAKVILMSTTDAREKAVQLGLDDFVSKLDFAGIGKIDQLLQKHGIEL